MVSETPTLFKNLFTLGQQLDQKNRWVVLSELVPWEELDRLYVTRFTKTGGIPLKPCRLIVGLMIGKHILKMSDRKIVQHFHENPYFQYFCGLDTFMTAAKGKIIHPSLLSKRRSRLGKAYFERFEKDVLGLLVKKGIVCGKTVAIDATVVPSHIEYPNDVKLLNVARTWLCNTILKVKNAIDPTLKIRTYARTARRAYLNYQKRKRKSRAFIEKHKKQMLRYVKRNVGQLSDLLKRYRKRGETRVSILPKHVRKAIDGYLKTAKTIYRQQQEMVKKKTRRVADRIVSFHQPQVRPMVRGKEGKPVEFGPKMVISSIGGFAVLNHVSHDGFSETRFLEKAISDSTAITGECPKEVLIDDGFSSRENRKRLADIHAKHSLKLVGQSTPEQRQQNRKLRAKRNRIEGLIGTLKHQFELDKIYLRVPGGDSIQTHLAIGTHNLVRALVTP